MLVRLILTNWTVRRRQGLLGMLGGGKGVARRGTRMCRLHKNKNGCSMAKGPADLGSRRQAAWTILWFLV